MCLSLWAYVYDPVPDGLAACEDAAEGLDQED